VVIEAIDEKQFRIELKATFPVLEALGTPTLPTPFIMPERLARTDPFTQTKEAIGSGPFRFVKEEWQPGHRVVYVKNADYVPRDEPPNWATGGKVVKVDRVEWLYIPDAVTAAQALSSGEVDYWEYVPNDHVPALEHDPNITITSGQHLIRVVRFNHLQPPFNNIKMRQAVLAVADQRDYLSAIAGDPRNWAVDTKKKELVGDFRNNGREYRPQGNPEEVRVHDFLIKELGRAVPYGIYDLAANSGWVSVGVDHDTAAFAVNSIRQWWQAVGRARYPNASRLLITADGGGSNGSRVRLWKCELQKLANELGLDIVVSHLPPGTSKWNKIEHRLFSFISQNWRAKPLVSYRVIVELISATTTKTGLTVRCQLDTGQYPSGIVVSDAEMAAINIQRAEFHGEWNYTISPDPHRPNRAFIS